MEIKLIMPRASCRIYALRCLCLLLPFSPRGYLHFVPEIFMRKQIKKVEYRTWFSVIGSHIEMVVIEQRLNAGSNVLRFPFRLFWILGFFFEYDPNVPIRFRAIFEKCSMNFFSFSIG